jgi:hypothetical protein
MKPWRAVRKFFLAISTLIIGRHTVISIISSRTPCSVLSSATAPDPSSDVQMPLMRAGSDSTSSTKETYIYIVLYHINICPLPYRRHTLKCGSSTRALTPLILHELPLGTPRACPTTRISLQIEDKLIHPSVVTQRRQHPLVVGRTLGLGLDGKGKGGV